MLLFGFFVFIGTVFFARFTVRVVTQNLASNGLVLLLMGLEIFVKVENVCNPSKLMNINKQETKS